MAVVFTVANTVPEHLQSLGSLLARVGTLTFSGSYATGGDSIDLAEPFRRIGRGVVFYVGGAFRGNTVEYDPVNKKLKMYASANTEVAAGAYNAALTATPIPVFIVGR